MSKRIMNPEGGHVKPDPKKDRADSDDRGDANGDGHASDGQPNGKAPIIPPERVAAIPAALKARPQWVCYLIEPGSKGKLTKVPYQARSGAKADSTDPATWTTFAAALAASGHYHGIGYVFSADDPFAGTDLDHCLTPEGDVEPWAERFVDGLMSYTERSQSGEGLHVIVEGRLPPNPKHKKNGFGPDGKGAVEMYDRVRYFVVTGDRWPGSPATIEPRAEELAAFYRETFPPGKRATGSGGPNDGDASTLTDDQVLDRARSAANGAKFRALYDDGDITAYDGDWSRADFALVCRIAWWVGPDRERIDRIFRRSSLCRLGDKWDDPRGTTTYGFFTIDNALALMGPGDFYAANGDKPGKDKKGKNKKGKKAGPDGASGYRERDGRLIAETDDGPATLSNFTARIITQIERHEHGEVRRQFQIEATHSDGSKGRALVDAEDYEGMRWVAAQLGAEWAITAARGTKDHVRAAIQLLSHRDGIGKATVHTSTGWVRHDGRPLYLHAGGAIGEGGSTNAVRVEVPKALERYALPDPPDDEGQIRGGIAACMRILDLAKADRPGAPAVASVLATLPWRAPLGPADFTIQFGGGSGTCKTSVALLGWQHFAVGIDRGDKLPVSWQATAGSLQRYAYDCKDTLLIVDELTGEHAVAVATEFVQCQGNLKSRDRMDKDFRVAPSLDPRGSVLSTGEADPSRQSALGRMLTARFSPATIDLDVLTACQRDAADGLYATAMAAYVRWLASGDRLDAVRAEHKEAVSRMAGTVRGEVARHGVHPRHPWIVAELSSAYRIFLRFATERGAITPIAAAAYAETVDRHLLNLVIDQGDDQREKNPGRRFLALLRAGLSSKRFHLIDANSDYAPSPYATACGWHKDWLYQGNEGGQQLDWKIPANSRQVGYIDLAEKYVYLGPEMAKEVARTMARGQGEDFENVNSLGRELADAKLIKPEKEGGKMRNAVQKRIRNAGKQRYFILPLAELFGEGGTDERPAD